MDNMGEMIDNVAGKLISKVRARESQNCTYALHAMTKNGIDVSVQSNDRTLCHENFKTFLKLVEVNK